MVFYEQSNVKGVVSSLTTIAFNLPYIIFHPTKKQNLPPSRYVNIFYALKIVKNFTLGS